MHYIQNPASGYNKELLFSWPGVHVGIANNYTGR